LTPSANKTILLNDAMLFEIQDYFNSVDVLILKHNQSIDDAYFEVYKNLQHRRKKNTEFLHPNHSCCSHCELEVHNQHCQHTTEYGCDARDMG